MILKNIKSPIVLFNVENFDINKEEFINKTKDAFFDLPWDYYDVRKMQLNYLEKVISPRIWKNISVESLSTYYEGKANQFFIDDLLDLLTKDQRHVFHQFKPSRRRSAARFRFHSLKSPSNWKIDRIPVDQFSQIQARIENDKKFDYRKCHRQFSETKDELIDSAFLKLIKGIVSVIKQSIPSASQFDIISHHTYVEARPDAMGDNSPEGIHQDGYDYIVSALVIERKNITGGMSQIFSHDKKTKLLVTELQPGQGILQPDKSTSLWHNVTPFSVENRAERGHRSSLGFDIGIIQ